MVRNSQIRKVLGFTVAFFIPTLICNVSIIISDVVAFIVVVRQAWGLWKLKKSLGLRSNQDLTTALLQQGIIRHSEIFPQQYYSKLLSINYIILICEFTLALRRRQSCATPSDFNQSTSSVLLFHNNPSSARSMRLVLIQLHESIVDEMGERNASVDIEPGGTDDSRGDGIRVQPESQTIPTNVQQSALRQAASASESEQP
ncbi:hypothetical protein Clacol_009736 [Clathrus columnatus]|uniref:Uncharacterized protein n=1 Tax=Clathrus columnatus TaxID=1419009 RepID=A0AAV5AQZ7_9AGAM|nr:hypothetical protein Clacol_009736 [Clathrus columnatus]